MDIALPANNGSVAQFLCDSVDRLVHVSLRLLPGRERLTGFQCPSGENGASPGAEILGSEIRATDLPQIIIHITGGHIFVFAINIHKLKEILAWDILTVLNYSRELAIRDLNSVFLSTLAPK